MTAHGSPPTPDPSAPPNPTARPAHDDASWLLRGGGEMGERIRAFDWATTPLGPPRQWPQSLRVAVGICLASQFPMFVWWGPELINLYNDAYAPVLGRRHPDALGRPAREIWADIWPAIGDDVEGVVRRGEPVFKERVRFVMERNGYPEVTYFTYSHSAIPDGHGGIGGLFQVCSDETAAVLSEKRDQFLLALDDAIRPLTDPEQITLTAARLLGEHLQVDRCAYADVEADQDTMNLAGNYTRTPGTRSIVGRLKFSEFGAEVLRLMRAGEPFVVHDVDTHAPAVGDPAAYRATQIRAVVCVPLHKGGRFVAAMAVHQRSPRRWTPHEVEVVRQVASRCWESIERARIHRTLRDGEELLRLALDSAELGSWHIDPATMELATDRRFREIFGVEGDRVGYEQAVALIHPDDRARVRASVAAACRPDDPVPHADEHRVVRPDGTVRWIFAKGRGNFAVRDGRRVLVSFDGTVADVTARRNAEDRARTILESITDAFFALDFEWRFTYVNPQAERLLHRAPGDLIGRVIWEVYPGLQGSEFERGYRRTMGERVAVSMTQFYPDHDRWYEVHAYPSPDGISLYFRDVSERKGAEEQERRLASEAVAGALAAAEANAKFRTFFEQGTNFAGLLTLDGTVIEANRLCLDACGFTREQVIGKKFWECGWWSPSAELAAVVRAGSAQAAAGTTFRRETDYFVADGSRRVVDLIIAPVTDDAGRVLFIAPSGVDVTDRRRMADERERLLEAERAARAEAERAGRLKDEFLATLSHELRTPLNAMLGWSQILTAGGGRDEQDLAEGLRTIERNARAQAQIIEDLLDMSRIISGKVRLDVRRVDLAEVVRGAVETARPAAAAKAIRLEAVLDPLAGPVAGDPDRMQQVFWNLLSNAVKFTPKGGRVQVLLGRSESQVRVSVADTGVGIKPEFLPFVFDRFRQADASTTRRHGGLGLGLAIVKHLVELHGGSVRVSSAGEGHGSTFVVSLPVTIMRAEPDSALSDGAPAAADESANAAARVRPLPRSAMDGVKVLVVDDEPDARALVKRLLEDYGAAVSTAGSVREAIDRLAEDRPDVLVSDIGMPDEDGYSLIGRVRNLGPGRGGDVPAVALTAYARSEDRTRAVLAGYQMHVSKPVEPLELIAIVASLAGRTGRPVN